MGVGITMQDRVDKLMRGSLDLHVHSGPSVMSRKLDHLGAVKEASKAGQRGILIKDHYYAGAPLVNLLKPLIAEYDVEIFSGIPLNNTSGGLNPFAVDTFLKSGAKLVWMPTSSAANHIRSTHRKTRLATSRPMKKAEAISVVDHKGNLVDEVKEILDLIAEFDAILSSGHLHISEIWPLFEEAKARGVNRRLVNHPSYVVGASLSDMAELTGSGAYVEHSASFYIESKFLCYTHEELAQHIKASGFERTILGSDLGQDGNPTPVEGMMAFIELILSLGFKDEDIEKMVSRNSARLIGLDE